ETLLREHARLCRSTGYLSLILLDVDFFKKFNDRYGHLQGDDCLRKIAQVMANAMQRPNDLAARYGGEEFAFILPDTDQEGAINIAERIRLAVIDLAIPHETSLVSNIVTVSMGVLTAQGGTNAA
ncbi:MAG: GGDEF domain-containing protein, partial [Deltaproteobacteria bacterium]|nr:GGDEF domain-containing protein [Deltaproteobacteria bacterium]